MTLAQMTSTSLEPGLTLGELGAELASLGARLTGDPGVRISDVRQDSRRVVPGDLFAARSGGQSDGTSFVRDSVARGARAVMIQRGTALPDVRVPIIEVPDVRLAVAFAAEAVHHLSLIHI